MNILLTGGAGFIGSNIAEAYLQKGHKVVVVDDLSTGRESNMPQGIIFEQIDIRNPSLFEIFEKHSIDFVNHHAAVADVRDAVRNPHRYLDINISGGLNILECARKSSIKGMVFSSSGGCSYGEPQYVPTDENHPLSPFDPYGTSKVCFELYIQTYYHLYGIPYVIFRYPNVYGPRQNPFGEAGVIAMFILRMLENRPLAIYGDGLQVRDFLYVDDIITANLLATEHCSNRIYNLGWGYGISINDIFFRLREVVGYQGEALYKPARLGEISKSILDSRRIRLDLGWEPKIMLEEGLKKTVDYIKTSELQSDK